MKVYLATYYDESDCNCLDRQPSIEAVYRTEIQVARHFGFNTLADMPAGHPGGCKEMDLR